MIDRPAPIDVTLVPEDQRLSVPTKLFSGHFLTVEQSIFSWADRLSFDYKGAYWNFYQLSNGGFYMAPDCEHTFYVQADNTFQGELEPDPFGITCCLYAYSHLSFSNRPELAEVSTIHYHRLRDAILNHPDGGKILAAAD